MASDRAPSGLVELLVFLYICLIPIGWSPFPAQIQWADLVFVGLLIAFVGARRRRPVTFHPLDWLIAGYLAASLVSFTHTPDVMQSSLELVKQGYLALVYWVFSLLTRERGVAAKILSWSAEVAAVLAAMSLLALVAYTGAGIRLLAPLLSPGPVPGLGEVVRIKGALLSPGFFCNYLTAALPILIALTMAPHRPTPWRRLRILLVAAAAVGTLTYSIVGFLGAGLVSVWRSWSATKALRSLRAAAASSLLVLFLAGNVIFAVSIRDVHWTADTNAQVPAPRSAYGFQDEAEGAQRLTVSVSYNPMSYALLKRVAVQAFLREPLTGIGLGTFHTETERAHQQGLIHAPYRWADPHAELLGRLAETGIIGGLTLLLLWWGVARFGWTLLRGAPGSVWMPRAILAGCFGVLVNSLNADVMNFRFVWVGLGLLRGQLERPAS